ncbi:hypothetical protein O987_02345 [Comamonas testosteroni TK102]|uniref:Uncharacterized protein n=1 Tax=Comamonas testosteroni TK102 TaxID=1392005 RepID=A0A076PMR0_COMTE|nr:MULTISPECIES: hypothetical protein [Comamonas]AIJ44657.1 hypothetical protein O987_02345 [Comamonas testosteroni TK102]MPS87946.1 hypothetical protein [Comamonas sp.]
MNAKVIEFIGPSGIGKTTFFNHLKGVIDPAWLGMDDVREIAKTQNVSEPDDIVRTIIYRKRENVEKLNRSEFQKKFIGDYFNEIITLDQLVSSSKNLKLINDDGVFHNFSKEILSASKEKYNEVQKLLLNRKIIYFTASSEKILDNLKERHQKTPGASNDWYGYTQKNSISIQEMIEISVNESEEIYNLVKSMGAAVMRINLDEDNMENIEKAQNFIDEHPCSVDFITKEDFIRTAELNNSKHWKTQPLENRWEYHEKSIQILKSLQISNPDEVLEIGTVGMQLLPGSETMDIEGYWNYEGKNPTYLHDARKTPWPPEKKYKAIVALRVFQYLAPFQDIAFNEAKKLGENLIIVTPRGREYIPKGMEETKGITYEEFLKWNDGNPPDFHQEMKLGDFYYWNFKK